MEVCILAGGLGTRIQSVRSDIPKPMFPIDGDPFLEYQLEFLRRNGLRDIVLCVGHLSHVIREYFQDGGQWGLNIRYSEESKSLGTAGAIRNASSILSSENFIVMNGDSLFDCDLNELIDFHETENALVTLGLVEMDETGRYGTVKVDSDGKIVEFVEKDPEASGNVNGGIYICNQNLLEKIPPDKKVSLEKEIFPELIGASFYGFSDEGYFIDIGIPEAYKQAKAELPQKFSSLSR